MDASYIAAYRKKRYAERKVEIIELLGGSCKKCGSVSNLEVDHIDPKKKKFEVMANCWCMAWPKLLEEIKKCQLLCESCHIEKGATAKGTHGTLSSYRYCKCDLCRGAHNEYIREYKRNHR